MVKAEGVYYTDHYGKKLIDASSGLFCSPAGHGRSEIRKAVYDQLERLDYVQPFQQGYNGSFELARKISQHTPGDLNRIFFTIFILAVYRFGTFVPIPGIDPEQLQQMMDSNQKGLLGMFNVFAGGAVGRMAIFALGIMPYFIFNYCSITYRGVGLL